MDIKSRNFSVSIKLTKNFNSINITEGFEVDVNEKFNEFDFEILKQSLKDKLVEETKKYMTSVDNKIHEIELDIEV